MWQLYTMCLIIDVFIIIIILIIIAIIIIVIVTIRRIVYPFISLHMTNGVFNSRDT